MNFRVLTLFVQGVSILLPLNPKSETEKEEEEDLHLQPIVNDDSPHGYADRTSLDSETIVGFGLWKCGGRKDRHQMNVLD